MSLQQSVKDFVGWLRPDPDPVGTREAFEAWCRARRRNEARLVAAVIFVFTLVWWPTDRVVLRGIVGATEAYTQWRVGVASLALAYFLCAHRLRSDALHTAVYTLATIAGTAVMGYTQSRVGGADRPWIHFTDLLAFAPVVMSFPLGTRVMATLCIAASGVAGYYLAGPHPEARAYELLWLSFLGCYVALSVIFGHAIFVLTVRNHAQSLAVERANRELEARVAEKTADLAALLSQVETARELERTRIARDLHDELGQEIAALRYALRLARRHWERSPGSVEGNFDELAALVDRTQATMRQILRDLRPRVLDDLGAVAAIEWLVERVRRRGDVDVSLDVEGDHDALGSEVALCLFRCTQEALNNALTHAAAQRVSIGLRVDPRVVHLTVRDDGQGFDPKDTGRGTGLLGMRERVDALHGRLRVKSAPGAGAEVDVTLPLRASVVPALRAEP